MPALRLHAVFDDNYLVEGDCTAPEHHPAGLGTDKCCQLVWQESPRRAQTHKKRTCTSQLDTEHCDSSMQQIMVLVASSTITLFGNFDMNARGQGNSWA